MATRTDRINVVAESVTGLVLAECWNAFRNWQERRKYWNIEVFADVDKLREMLDSVTEVCNVASLLYTILPSHVSNWALAQHCAETVQRVSDWISKSIDFVDTTLLPELKEIKPNGGPASSKRRNHSQRAIQKYLEEAQCISVELRKLLKEHESVLSTALLADISSNMTVIAARLNRVYDCNSPLSSLMQLTNSLVADNAELGSALTRLQKEEERRLVYELRCGHLLTFHCIAQLEECLKVNVAEYGRPDPMLSSYFLHEVFVSVPCSVQDCRGGSLSTDALTDLGERLRDKSAFRVLLVGGPGYGKSSILQVVGALCHISLLHLRRPLATLFPLGQRQFSIKEIWVAFQNRFAVSGDPHSVPKNSEIDCVPSLAIFLTFKELDKRLINDSRMLIKVICEEILRVSQAVDHIPSDDLHEYLASMFRRYRTVFMFDGLDEVFDDVRRVHLVRTIISFLDSFSLTESAYLPSCIISSRPSRTVLTDLHIKHGFHLVELADLRTELVELYASSMLEHAYHVKPGTAQFQQCMKRIGEWSSSNYFGRCCLQVAMVTDIIRQGYSLPTALPRLFRFYVKQVIQREVAFKVNHFRDQGGFCVVEDEVTAFHRWMGFALYHELLWNRSAPLTHQRCEYIAQVMFVERGISEQSERARKVSDLMKVCEERFCFLVSRQPGTLEFSVQTFLEYFAAEFMFEEVACFSKQGISVEATRAFMKAVLQYRVNADELHTFLFGGALLGRASRADPVLDVYLELDAAHGSAAALAILQRLSLDSQSVFRRLLTIALGPYASHIDSDVRRAALLISLVTFPECQCMLSQEPFMTVLSPDIVHDHLLRLTDERHGCSGGVLKRVQAFADFGFVVARYHYRLMNLWPFVDSLSSDPLPVSREPVDVHRVVSSAMRLLTRPPAIDGVFEMRDRTNFPAVFCQALLSSGVPWSIERYRFVPHVTDIGTVARACDDVIRHCLDNADDLLELLDRDAPPASTEEQSFEINPNSFLLANFGIVPDHVVALVLEYCDLLFTSSAPVTPSVQGRDD
jgi:hypothetical protein